MADPQTHIGWYEYTEDGNDIRPLTRWSLGTVEAAGNDELTRKTFIIWSNRGGSVGLPTLRECRIGTRDISGGFNHPLVRGLNPPADRGWVRGKFKDSEWIIIGASLVDGEWIPDEMEIQAMGNVETGTIESGANDGTMGSHNAKNYSIFDLKIAVPAGASAGPVQANLRLGFTIS